MIDSAGLSTFFIAIMALKVKAVEKLLKFDKESAGKYRYVMKPGMYSSLI